MKTRQKTVTQLQKQVDEFNKTYAIGCAVDVRKDSGEIVAATVKDKAIVLGGHSAVGFFTGFSGCYDLDRVNSLSPPPFNYKRVNRKSL